MTRVRAHGSGLRPVSSCPGAGRRAAGGVAWQETAPGAAPIEA
jgi:hypothetical protein